MKSYLPRHIERQLKLLSRHFKVVLVTGARQVGKSTLLRHVFPKVKSVVFDPIQDIFRAREDPDFFLETHPSPLILDDIQFAPELLPALKRKVDRSDKPGQYFLTGSQNLSVLRTASESLAGRVGILNLQTMTLREIEGKGKKDSFFESFFANSKGIPEISGNPKKPRRMLDILWRGGFPALSGEPNSVMSHFFRSYIQTYVERDVRVLEDIREFGAFGRFLGLIGALTGQEINHSQIGRDVGVNPGTARKWLELLVTTFQWFELSSFHGNAIKRINGKRKGFLSDSGLACHLQKISSPEALGVSPLLGAIFETWVSGTIRKQCSILDVPPNFYHWRTNGGAEVDLILERDGFLYPIEIKCKTNLTGHDLRGIRAFQETYPKKVKTAFMVYAGNDVLRMNDFCFALPWHLDLILRKT